MDLTELNDAFAARVKSSSHTGVSAAFSCDEENVFQFHQLCCNEVERSLSTMNTNTASGCDGLPAFLIHKLAAALAPNITKIFIASLSRNILPDAWRKAHITPI